LGAYTNQSTRGERVMKEDFIFHYRKHDFHRTIKDVQIISADNEYSGLSRILSVFSDFLKAMGYEHDRIEVIKKPNQEKT
jgi:hypothetical protein